MSRVESKCNIDGDCVIPRDTSSDPEIVTPEEIPSSNSNTANKLAESSWNFNKANDLISYMRGLNDIVNKSIQAADEFDKYYRFVSEEAAKILSEKRNFESELECSHESEIESDSEFEPEIEYKSETDDEPENELPLEPSDDINSLSEFLTPTQLSTILEATVSTVLDEFKSNEETSVLATSIGSYWNKLLLIRPLRFFSGLLCKIQVYMMYNRPVVDMILVKSYKSYRLKFKPDLSLVYHELQKVSTLKLEMIVQNTDCPQQVRTKLYDSILKGDVTSFVNLIEIHESEASILVNFAYELNYYNELCQDPESLIGSTSSENLLFDKEEYAFILDTIRLQYPFLENTTESIEIKHPVFNFNEYILSTWFRIVECFEMMKESLISSERIILSKVTKLIDRYPMLRDAYKEYKSKQNVSVVTDTAAKKLLSGKIRMMKVRTDTVK